MLFGGCADFRINASLLTFSAPGRRGQSAPALVGSGRAGPVHRGTACGPPVATPRLSLSSTGKVLYTLKTPYRDGTTQVAFDPVDFIARLAALVPKPRVNLTRYHGVLAPNHRWRGMVTPAKRGKGVKRIANTEVRSPAERHVAMSWAQRLKRVST